MKKSIRKSFGTALLLVALVSGSFAQDYYKMEGSKLFQLKQESSPSIALINVSEGYNYLKIHVVGIIQTGQIQCEILDPAGEVKRTFNIICSDEVIKGENTGYQSDVKGEMEKAFRNPALGKWEIRVIPKNAVGDVRIKHVLISHPKADMLELYQIEEETNSRDN